jgi:hypothetical protein
MSHVILRGSLNNIHSVENEKVTFYSTEFYLAFFYLLSERRGHDLYDW